MKGTFEESYIVPKSFFDKLIKNTNFFNKNNINNIETKNNTEETKDLSEKKSLIDIEKLQQENIIKRKSFDKGDSLMNSEYILTKILNENNEKAKNILDFINKNNNAIGWSTKNGEISINNNIIPNTNILNILQVLLGEIRPSPIYIPPGVYEIFYKLQHLGYDMKTIFLNQNFKLLILIKLIKLFLLLEYQIY